MGSYNTAVCLAAVLLWPSGALAHQAKEARAFPLTYEGGSLPLHRNKLQAALGQDEVVFKQKRARIGVPAKDITQISCRSEVHRRFGAAVLGVVPLLRLGEVETRYVGVTWTTAGGPATAQVVLRLNKSDYDRFLAGLERLTGMKATDTGRAPVAVRYGQ